MRKFVWLAVFASLTATAAYGPTDFLRYAHRFDGTRIVARGLFEAQVPRFADLERDRDQFRTYEEFVGYLLAKVPALRKNAVLIHHSESLQLSSLEHPRVILFEGGVAFGFSEHPANRERTVEMMEVDPDTYRVSLNELAFTRDGVEFRKNPESCASCHGSPAKALWAPYDFWPNAFGSTVGIFGSKEEKTAYEKVLAGAAQSPLLRELELPASLQLGDDPLTPFTQFIGQANFGRIGDAIFKSPRILGYHFPLMAILNSCHLSSNPGEDNFAKVKGEILQYFRPGELSQNQVSRLDQIYQDVVSARRHMKAFQDEQSRSFFPGSTPLFRIDHGRLLGEVVPVTILHWLLEMAGEPGANSSTSHTGNEYFISTPSNFNLDLLASAYERNPGLFSGLTLKPMDLGMDVRAWIGLSCEELRQKSLAATRAPAAPASWRSFREDQPERPVVARCAKCHSERLAPGAPPIPFHDPMALAQLLRAPGSTLHQRILARIESTTNPMPPEFPLSQEEKAALAAFLKVLQ